MKAKLILQKLPYEFFMCLFSSNYFTQPIVIIIVKKTLYQPFKYPQVKNVERTLSQMQQGK